MDAETAHRLAERVPEHVLTVGVFRNQSIEEVRSLADASEVRAVQLHGDEGQEHYDALRRPGRTLIRATAVGERVPRCGEFGEDMLLVAFTTLGITTLAFTGLPIGLPLHLPFLFLALLTGTLQALVFTVLSTIYFLLMLPHDDHGHEAEAHHAH